MITEITVTLFVGNETVKSTYPLSMLNEAYALFNQYIDSNKKATISTF